MQYGYFDNERKEYVITRPDTPTPWINYLGGGGFSGIISQTGGGLCFDGDPSFRRVTRYKFNSLPADRPGRYLYVRDMETGDYWSPTWQPVMKTLTHYECRHGLGYTVISGTYDGIKTTITYYVPPQAGYEVWRVEMINQSDRPRKLRLFSYVEFSWNDAKYDTLCHWPSMALLADFADNKIVVDTVAQQLTGTPQFDYIATDFPVDGYDCSQNAFIGFGRSETDPVVVEQGVCTNSSMHSDNCVGVLSSSIELAVAQKITGCYTLGAVKDPQEIDQQVAEAFDQDKQEQKFTALKEGWNTYLNTLQVETPDADVNTMLNIWHPYQAKTTFNWSRFISIYERGVDRGFGFRDSMQDVLGVTAGEPEQVKERIKLLLSIQFKDGSARSVYYPATGKAEGGGRSDDHLWAVYSVCHYIKETGDTAFLEETVAYEDGGTGTVREHLERALHFTCTHLGKHGLPDMLHSDWNDSLAPMNWGEVGGAESVFVFFQLAHAAYELKILYRHLGITDGLKYVTEIYDACAQKLDLVWDGDWFLRAFTPYGEKYGTHEDEWNRICLNPQSWAVLSRLPDQDQANRAMDHVMKYLYTDNGLLTQYPAVSGFDPVKKRYFLFAAGAKENGGIFFHSNTWAVIALAMLKRNEDAWKCYYNSLPSRRNNSAEISQIEPYVYCSNMLAAPHDRAGVCVNSWLTGTASWMFIAVAQYILGIRPEYEGLCIDPCIPSQWPGFSATRVCRGVACHICVKRNAAATGLEVEGQAIEGNTIPWTWFEGRKELNIVCYL